MRAGCVSPRTTSILLNSVSLVLVACFIIPTLQLIHRLGIETRMRIPAQSKVDADLVKVDALVMQKKDRRDCRRFDER